MKNGGKQISTNKAEMVRQYAREAHELRDLPDEFRRHEVPDSVSNTVWRKLRHRNVVEVCGTEPSEGGDPRNVYRIPEQVDRYLRDRIQDEREQTLCPVDGCLGTGFTTTSDGFRCQECAEPIRRECIERYYGGNDGD